MQTYWLQSSKSLVKGMIKFHSTKRLLCIFGTRLLFILMMLQTHQGPVWPVFIICSKIHVFRRQHANILVVKLKIIRKILESIPLNQETALYFVKRLSFILVIEQIHQCPLGPVVMISYKIVVLRRQYAKILVAKLKIIRKRYESIPFNQETALYFWYKIIIHPDEATDSSVYSWACFHYFL